LYVRLDRQEVVKDKIEWQVAVHTTKLCQ
jgi:hypothetical protein